MVSKILVHGDSVLIHAKMHPLRLDIHQPVTLLKKKNVGRYFCSGILLKGCIREPHGSYKLYPLRKVFPHLRTLFVHRPLARHKGYDSSRPYLIQCFCKEIIMDLEIQPVIRLVTYLVVSEWHVAYGHIKEIILKIGLLKAADTDIRLGVKLLCNAPGESVKLHAVQPAVLHRFRQHSEKVPDAHGRLQYISLFKSQLTQNIINTPDDYRACKMCIQRAFSG